ncbi:amino acid permease [Leucobacter sp. UCMA 4100]|uniref:amino acid permease n=1 Tax=Leucobacter sp. UCMA 4100 TaxID=2810534 RepID=UPI0022EB3B18|nr:amino acid permease [Leucobacter sp. UCMA 4100]MDA3146469.1 amino acid permease [Leucobacter sp. UCMA 4100]
MSQGNPALETEHRTLRREFNFGSVFAFAFAFISPIVALYGIFGIAVAEAGPSFWWGFLIVFGGQFLVALVFATLVSRWPIEGSVYQWATRLIGSAYGWFAGWFYICTLVIAMTTVALGAAGFIANILGVRGAGATQVALIAFVLLIVGTIINLLGRGVLKVFMVASIIAEIFGSIGLGIWLLIAHRTNSITILFDQGESVGASDGYFTLGGPFLLAVVFIGFSFVGFESAGAIAEEVHEPRKNLPKAVLFSLTIISLIVMFSSLAIILAMPENASQLPGYAEDPVHAVLTALLGSQFAIPIQVLFSIGFIASFLALQTSASRLIWAKARDGALPFSRSLSVLTKKQSQPIGPIIITTVIGTALLLMSNVAENIYEVMVSFTSGGFYLSFLFPVLGFVVALFKKRWVSGPFSLGVFTKPVAVAALIWVVLELVNIAWPRAVNGSFLLDWSVIIGVGTLALVGALVYASVRKRIENVETSAVVIDAPKSDASRADRS